MKEFRFENYRYRWTVIDTHIVDGVMYALAESSIGDEAPGILFKVEKDKIKVKDFHTKNGDVVRLPLVPSELIIADDIYDDIMVALDDCCLLINPLTSI